jgi:hypothetical protein
MDEVLLVAVPVALIAAAAALLRPARQRVVPVARAVGRTGTAVASVTAAGTRGIVDAAIHGEGSEKSGTPGGGSARTATTRTPRRARTTTAKAPAGGTSRRPSGAAKR